MLGMTAPEQAWAALCVDEALHFHHVLWADRKARRDAEAAEEQASGGKNLYSEIKNDRRLGRPPSVAELRLLPTIEDEPPADANSG